MATIVLNKKAKQLSFEQPAIAEREPISHEEALSQTISVLQLYGSKYKTWIVTFSGGKDSTTTLTVILWCILNGLCQRPERLIVLRSDTGQEMTELDFAAEQLMQHVRDLGFEAYTVAPDTKDKYWPQILGKGLLPVYAGQRRRWCTRSIKTTPMTNWIRENVLIKEFYYTKNNKERVRYLPPKEKFLSLSGVRMNESEMRTSKLQNSLVNASQVYIPACSAGGECGSVWVEESMSKVYDMLPVIVNWRTCQIFDWLVGLYSAMGDYTKETKHGFEKYTKAVARLYGWNDADGSQAEESARFGCYGCSAVQKDKMVLRAGKKTPELLNLLEIYDIYSLMRSPAYRLAKLSDVQLYDDNGNRKAKMGPLTIEARRLLADKVKNILGRAGLSNIITPEDWKYIQECWQTGKYPRGWTGNEPTGDQLQKEMSGQLSFEVED